MSPVEEITVPVTKPVITEKDEVNIDAFALVKTKPIEISSSTEASVTESEPVTSQTSPVAATTIIVKPIENVVNVTMSDPVTQRPTVAVDESDLNKTDSINVYMVLSTTKLENNVFELKNNTEKEILTESTTVSPVVTTSEAQLLSQNSDEEELLQILSQLNITLNETNSEVAEINKETTTTSTTTTTTETSVIEEKTTEASAVEEKTTETSPKNSTEEISTTTQEATKETSVFIQTEPIVATTESPKNEEIVSEAITTEKIAIATENMATEAVNKTTTMETVTEKQLVEDTTKSVAPVEEEIVPLKEKEDDEEYNLCENPEIDEITRTEWGNAFIFKGRYEALSFYYLFYYKFLCF